MLQSIRQVGAVLGVAIMGSALASTYRAQVDVTGLAPDDAAAVRVGATGGQAVAERLGRPDTAASVIDAFAAGVSAAFWVGAGVSVACVLGVAAMRRRVGSARMPA